MQIIKRNGDLVDFDRAKITEAIRTANNAVTNRRDQIAKDTIQLIVSRLYERIRKRTSNTLAEELETMVAIELMKERAYEVAVIYLKQTQEKEGRKQ